jgi:cell division GTPase FtsZ
MAKVMEQSDMVITYSNDSLLKVAPNLPLRRAFGAMDIIMMAPVLELANALTVEDLTQVRSDFGACKHVRAGIGIGSGLDRGLRAVEEAFNSPWFDFDVRTARTALVMASARDMDEAQLQKVVRDVSLRLPGVGLRYAGREDPEMGERMKVVLLLGVGPASL